MSAGRRVRLLAIAMVAAIALSACGSDGPPGDTPPEFFGVAPQDPVGDPDLARMARGGVRSYHLLLSWTRANPAPDRYNWARYDELVGKLAVNGLQPIPYVFGTPGFLADEPSTGPTGDAALDAWEAFLGAATERYGPGGDFWKVFAGENPDAEPRPFRDWEIWNEPNSSNFWGPEPSPEDYGNLLERAAGAIGAIDPEARIMVAGMFATPQAEGSIDSYAFLDELYRQDGVAEAADLVGIHPYGPRIDDVREQIERTRRVMERAGEEAAGIWVTEIGWGSDPSVPSALAKSPERQAELLRGTYEMLIDEREAWKLQGALWYTWRDPLGAGRIACAWCPSAGLVEADLDAKPAWIEYAKLSGGEP